MSVKSEVENLNKKDIYSLILFALYKFKDIPEYSSLSEMAFILDKDNLLKLFQYFGGTTIHIPTIQELENIVYSLLIYEFVNVDNLDYENALKLLDIPNEKIKEIRSLYKELLEVMKNYNFQNRGIVNES